MEMFFDARVQQPEDNVFCSFKLKLWLSLASPFSEKQLLMSYRSLEEARIAQEIKLFVFNVCQKITPN